MENKINGKRLYKLTKVIIWAVSVLSLLVATIYKANYDQIANRAMEETKSCFDRLGAGVGTLSTYVCGGYYEDLGRVTTLIWIGYIFGIGLPVIFFGGKALSRYLTSEDKTSE